MWTEQMSIVPHKIAIGRIVINLEDGGELVRVERVQDRVDETDEQRQEAGHTDRPEAPAELEA